MVMLRTLEFIHPLYDAVTSQEIYHGNEIYIVSFTLRSPPSADFTAGHFHFLLG